MQILVADDSPFYCCMLEQILSGWGYDVVTVRDGEAALAHFQGRDHPRLAVVDWMMPRIDGLELCRRIRALPQADPTYVILLTAKDGKANVITGLQAGADDYLSKPFDRDELRVRLQVGMRIVALQESLGDRVGELEKALFEAQKMEAIGRLAGGVAHDFNNLLTVILGATDFLLMGLNDPRHRELVSMIKEAGDRGASLTHRLLAFSRKQILNPEVFLLNCLLSNVETLLGRLIGENIELITDLDPNLGHVTADRGQTEQVVINLVVNARDAMPGGGRIVIETKNVDVPEGGAENPFRLRPGAYAMLSVCDNGCGIDEETRAHLFEPFFTTKEQGKGTGLGLAMIHGFVHQTGGQIRMESQPGQGTTFRIFLQRTEAPSETLNAVAPPSAAPGRHETILLVEDEDAVRLMTRQILKTRSYTVLEARDGYEANQISAGWQEPIDLLVTDVIMPQMNGRQLADRLLIQRPGMKVLFMSGYTDEEILPYGVGGSRDCLLQKPFTPPVLASKVREILDA